MQIQTSKASRDVKVSTNNTGDKALERRSSGALALAPTRGFKTFYLYEQKIWFFFSILSYPVNFHGAKK